MPRSPFKEEASFQAVGTGEALKAHSAASLEYIRVEENGQ
jgi:hypothetical protein